MKTIEYMGQEFEVEDYVKFVAADSDGCVYGYVSEPILERPGPGYFYSLDICYLSYLIGILNNFTHPIKEV